jgi:transposase
MDLKYFEISKQVSSYLGMAPSIISSGSSRGQSRITKTGNNHTRNLLFLSSFTACKYNPSCKQLFDRITGVGKSKKASLITVGNKLIKQAFALAKSGQYFNPEFVSIRN